MRRERGDRAAHLLGHSPRSDPLERRVVVDVLLERRGVVGEIGRIGASSRPPAALRARLRATAPAAASVPRSGSYWPGCVMKCTKVSWVTSAACAPEPE